MSLICRLMMFRVFLVICLFPASKLSDDHFGHHHGMEQHHHRRLEIEITMAEALTKDTKKENISFSAFSNKTTDSFPTNPTIRGGEASDPQSRSRRKFVKEMMKHAWDGYVAHAWGKNEVRPVSKSGNSGTVFGASDCGATIVDSMDTLYIMGMEEEFSKGREWIANNLNLTQMSEDVNVFEINIRYVGGLLSLFAFTGDEMFKTKAVEIVEKLLPAFDTPTGVPHGKVNMQTGMAMVMKKMSVLSEFGTLHMEFSYLSDITGNYIYKEKVETLRDYLDMKVKPKNLYPNFLNPITGDWGQNHCSVGALGDSFYEYLLKEWLRSGKTDGQAKKMFDEAATGIEQKLLQNSSQGQTYLADWRGGMLDHKMDHLACFAGGMFALAARDEQNPIGVKWMKIAEGITKTCHESYEGTLTKLGPEVIMFNGFFKPFDRSYLLRPETVESFFIMWRMTKNPTYREWGWKVVQALELNCKVEGGYSGIRNVNVRRSTDDVQQSFFLAETLKYLYLLFSDDDLIDLNQWVFNTEAHPLPVKGVNPFYRAYDTTDTSKIVHLEL